MILVAVSDLNGFSKRLPTMLIDNGKRDFPFIFNHKTSVNKRFKDLQSLKFPGPTWPFGNCSHKMGNLVPKLRTLVEPSSNVDIRFYHHMDETNTAPKSD